MKVAFRALGAPDRPLLAQLLARIESFDEADQEIALELIDIALNQPEQIDYLFILAVNENDQPVGYACYGPTPLTDRAYNLYWIAVDPALAGQGIGTQILLAVEQVLNSQRARMLLIETSSGADYELTRRFYLKVGYFVLETLKDFYRDGEDRVIFGKRFIKPDRL